MPNCWYRAAQIKTYTCKSPFDIKYSASVKSGYHYFTFGREVCRRGAAVSSRDTHREKSDRANKIE